MLPKMLLIAWTYGWAFLTMQGILLMIDPIQLKQWKQSPGRDELKRRLHLVSFLVAPYLH